MDNILYEAPGVCPDPTIPVRGVPEGLMNAGSLLYLEPALQNLSAFPTEGDVLRNYARGALSGLTGGGIADANGPGRVAGIAGGVALELTDKGALHGFFNPAATAGYEGFDWVPQQLVSYMLAHPTDAYYVDSMIRQTATPVLVSGSGTFQTPFALRDTGRSNVLEGRFYSLRFGANSEDTQDARTEFLPSLSYSADFYAKQSSFGSVMLNALGRDSLPPSWTDAGGPDGVIEGLLRWTAPTAPGGILQGGTAFVFYSAYMENLTVSGRSWAEVHALRQAQKASAFAEGGRYYGDTWTDPATYVWG